MNTNEITSQLKKVQENVVGSAHKVWLASLGAASTVREETGDWFDNLVERGRTVETKGRKELNKELKKAKNQINKTRTKVETKVEAEVETLNEKIDRQVSSVIHRFGVPSRREIRNLTERVQELTEKVDAVGRDVAAPAKSEAKAETVETRVYYVAPHGEGWKVAVEGSDQITSLHNTKSEAVASARDLAKDHEPSAVVIHRMDGTIQTRYSYGD